MTAPTADAAPDRVAARVIAARFVPKELLTAAVLHDAVREHSSRR